LGVWNGSAGGGRDRSEKGDDCSWDVQMLLFSTLSTVRSSDVSRVCELTQRADIQSITWERSVIPAGGPLVPVADLQSRRTLRSAGTNRLVVPSVRLSTAGSRAFSVAAPRIWNALPAETTSAQSLTSFRRHLKSWLFSQSYPDLII